MMVAFPVRLHKKFHYSDLGTESRTRNYTRCKICTKPKLALAHRSSKPNPVRSSQTQFLLSVSSCLRPNLSPSNNQSLLVCP
jgi:hypothetical protein